MEFILLFLLFTIVAIILATKGTQRAVCLFVGIFILNDTINIGPINAYTMHIAAFIISLFIHDEIKKEWTVFPFKGILYLLLLAHVGVALFDGRINDNLIKVISRIFNNFMPQYMALFVGYSLLSNLREWRNLIMPLFVVFSVMGIYGLASWFVQSNPYYDMMNEMFRDEPGIWREVQSRGYRVFSTLTNPIVYGFVMCMAGHLIFLWRKHIPAILWTALFPLVALNVFLANSRTGIVAGILLVIIFLLSKYQLLSWRMYASLAASMLVLSIAYFTVPPIHDVTDSVIDVFMTGGEHTGGSNVALKVRQLQASAYYFTKAPFFGNGFTYFHEVIRKEHIAFSGELAGMEGYLYKLLIEQGVFMIIAACIFFGSVCAYFFRRRYLGDYAHAGMAWTLSVLFFLIFAGDYGGIFTIGMILTGLLLKFIQLYEILYLDTSLQCSSIYRAMPGQYIDANGE